MRYLSILSCLAGVITVHAEAPSLYIAQASSDHEVFKGAYLFQAINNILDQEEEKADTHFCLYHAMNTSVFINLLALTYLDHFMCGTPLADDFIKLRCDHDLYQETLPLRSYTQRPICDHHWPYKQQLLAVNLSFPGCLAPGECTVNYFLESQSITEASGVQEYILSRYATTQGMKSRLHNTLSQWSHYVAQFPCGVLLQICIPQHLINQCVYLSRAGGRPVWIERPGSNTLEIPDMQKVLTYIRDNPKALYSVDLQPDVMQARIRLDRSLFAQPGQVQIYAHHNFPHQVDSNLYHDIYKIISEEDPQSIYPGFLVTSS